MLRKFLIIILFTFSFSQICFSAATGDSGGSKADYYKKGADLIKAAKKLDEKGKTKKALKRYERAKKYLLTGEMIQANDAHEMGLIAEVVEEELIDQEVQKLAEKLRDGAKYSIRWTKTSINAGLKVMANSIIDRAAAYENVTQLMEDHKIALEAFARKENPKFKQK